MRILLTGGGSGGHIFPLVAVARKLKEKDAPHELLFIGPDKFARQVFAKENIASRIILSGKMRRYFSPLILLDMLKAPIGFSQTYWRLLFFMPDVVFSKGGYGSAMPVFMAWLFRIPIIIHESDSVPGLTNRLFSKISKKILVSFEESARFFSSKKTVVVGNPVREELFFEVSGDERKAFEINSNKPVIFFMGGSQGAEQINILVLAALSDFVGKYEIIHQCGDKNFEKIKKLASLSLKNAENQKSYRLFSSLNDNELRAAYAASNVIVSRAGSGSIFEIAAAGKPSILIPYNFSAGKHQEKNAHNYAKTGAAIVLEGTNLTPHMLLGEIEMILNNPERVKAMSQAARHFAKPEAASKIAEEIVKSAI